MLDAFTAQQIEPTPDGVLAWVGGFRFAFSSSERDRDQMVSAGGNEPCACEIEFDVENGRIVALAFASVERRALYRELRLITGIGRVTALAVLNAGGLLDTLRAVAGEDAAYFKPVPNLGPKRIATVLGELRRHYLSQLPRPLDMPVGLLVEARDALVASGQDAFEAEQVLLGCWRTTIRTAEQWLEAATA
jgi:Holliday junction resolvasome RuvABC DNA-binding subunit